jgi:hypothetical protein
MSNHFVSEEIADTILELANQYTELAKECEGSQMFESALDMAANLRMIARTVAKLHPQNAITIVECLDPVVSEHIRDRLRARKLIR